MREIDSAVHDVAALLCGRSIHPQRLRMLLDRGGGEPSVAADAGIRAAPYR